MVYLTVDILIQFIVSQNLSIVSYLTVDIQILYHRILLSMVYLTDDILIHVVISGISINCY